MTEKKDTKTPASTKKGREEIKTPLKKIKVEKPKAEEDVKIAEKKPAKRAEKPADFAVIRTGGKQYIVRVGEKHKFEKLEAEEGETVKFDDVLFVKKGDKFEVGAPKVQGAIVESKVVTQGKGDKIIVFKYKKRKNYRRKQGHRQSLTEVEIVKI